MSKLYIDETLRIAAGEVGYCEKATNAELDSQTANAGNGNWTKYARDLWAANPHYYQSNKNGYDWCAVFVDWCIYMACGEDAVKAQNAMCYTGPYGAGCPSSVMYYREAGRFKGRLTADPKPGDQIFFGTSDNIKHTGIVENVANGKVTTIEGNSSNKVRRRTYALTDSTIYGYGFPRYDGETAPKEPENAFPFVDVPEGKYYTEAVKWCWENGITAGTDATHFSPKAPVKRCDLCVMLKKLYDLMEGGG